MRVYKNWLTVMLCVGVGAFLVFGVLSIGAQKTSAKTGEKPNIIVIVADDLGYAEISAYRIRRIPTPHIDSIASEGVLFTHGYVSAPICGPSRAGLMTGRHQQRFGFEFNDSSRRTSDTAYGLALTERTLGAALKAQGYRTAAIGKWHLGHDAGFYPTERGFDEFYGFLSGSTLYIDPKRPDVISTNTDDEIKPRKDHSSWRNGKRKQSDLVMRGADRVIVNNMDRYLTEDFADQASDFIRRNAKTPFFLYLAFNAPHTPFQVTRKYYDRFPEIKDENNRIYAAMISALDDAVGQVLETLSEEKVKKNTLVIFISDNGCATPTGVCLCAPLRGGKISHYEGGVRVPFMMRWPAKIKKNLVYSHAVSALDIFPTALRAAGGVLSQDHIYDGVDLLPYLGAQGKNLPHPELYWLRRPQASILADGWKLWASDDGKVRFLFDLHTDPNEQINLYEARPDKVRELSGKLAQWRKDMVSPSWPTSEVTADICGVDLTLPF